MRLVMPRANAADALNQRLSVSCIATFNAPDEIAILILYLPRKLLFS